MKVLVMSGSRADEGLLEWPVKLLREEFMLADFKKLRNAKDYAAAAYHAKHDLTWASGVTPFDVLLVLGDRWEILALATEAHLRRIPIAHIGGGDVTEGSYDDAMRDCISRMASIHFVTSTSAMARLTHMGCRNVHLVGSPGIDYIRQADWKRDRPFPDPYVVVSYQAETIDGTVDKRWWLTLPNKRHVYIRPNMDRGSEEINAIIDSRLYGDNVAYDFLPHDEFLNLLAHCDEFIGNSSAMLYEAPELRVKTRMIGKRQRGRTIPMGDGFASKRIVNILKYASV